MREVSPLGEGPVGQGVARLEHAFYNCCIGSSDRRYPIPATYELHGLGRGKRPAGLPKGPVRIDRTELAWAAGLFVGEGDITASSGGWEVHLHVSQSGEVDRAPDLLVRFREAVSCMGFVEGPQFRPGRMPKWRFRASGYEIVQAIVAMLWPWLGSVKKAQARRHLLARRALPVLDRRPGNRFGRPLNRVCVRGHDYSDVYVNRHGARCCRPCARIRSRESKRRKRAALRTRG